MAYRVGIDVGGTFTDLLLLHEETGRTVLYKTPSTPGDPAVGVFDGLRRLLDREGVDPAELTHVMHGTTVATNAVLEGRGARVGLLVTEGFEQLLHLARGETPGPLAGWVTMIKPEPLAAVEDTRGIRERIGARGDVVVPLDLAQAAAAIDELVADGVESLAISLLNAYASPQHERALRDLVRERAPGVSLSLSSDVLPEFREYERTNVVVMNAYVRPAVAGYLDRLRSGLGAATLAILRSDGGLTSVDAAVEKPIHILFSGPAGGVAGAVRVARGAGYPSFLSLDMGGTSTDVALCLDGEPIVTRETNLGTYPITVPSIDVRSVGAGGGSIAHVPEVTKALRVGPDSAGADPGPAAYGRGGTRATVTDANLVLGYLSPQLAGGELQLDVELARRAVGEIAAALGLTVEAAAEGIVDVVNETMMGALRLVSVERGHDPRELALLAFGGAGPLHANALGALMGSFPVIVPPTPGVLAALGDVVAPSRTELSETWIRRFDAVSATDVTGRLRALEAEVTTNEDVVEVRFALGIRYHKQALEMAVPVVADGLDLDEIAERFALLHEREYGFRLDAVCELVTLRATGIGPSFVVEPEPTPRAEGAAPRSGTQTIYHRGRWHEAALYDRAALLHGHRLAGPAVVNQADSTTLILPGYTAEVDAQLNLVIGASEIAREAETAESPIVIDIIENALKNIRREQDAVVFRAAMSTVIREEHDSFPLLADDRGRMLAGQFGWPLDEFFERYPKESLEPGDVLMMNDPYLVSGAVQHTPDMLLLRPIFFEGELVGFASQMGNLMDIGGASPGSMPARSRSIFEEGIRFPPVKLYERGKLQQSIMDILARNSRTPELTVADTLALAAATRAAEQRVIELCARFGVETYRRTCERLLERTHEAAKLMLDRFIPEEPLRFWDVVDDDGRGNGPFRIELAMWRENGKAILDFAGTSPQAEGPINLYMGENMFKMVSGIILIMALDPQILFNHGYNDLFEIRFPKGSLIQPDYPAPLSNRSHTLARIFDVLSGALAQQAPELSTGAACGSSPHFLFSGTDPDGEFFFYYEINYGGIPGRPVGDGMDVHAWWPHVTSIPVEYAEAYFPLRIERLRGAPDSGGPGFHRGGNGVEKVYEFLAPGEVSIHDDRAVSRPWGIGGGLAASGSSKALLRCDGTRQELGSKFDFLHVEPGDRLLYITAGGGGFGDPLARDPEAVARDVRRGFVSEAAARARYGVVLGDQAATQALRADLAAGRPSPLPVFDFGPGRSS